MLTFERGETEKSFTFFAEPDNESDDGETVMVSFAALPAMVQKGDPSEATMKLRDNGSPSEDGITCIDNNRANIVTVLSARGEISSPGEIDSLVIPDVDPYRTYFVEILGADSNVDIWGQNVGGGSLTLADPHPVSLSNVGIGGDLPKRQDSPLGSSDGGTGRNARVHLHLRQVRRLCSEGQIGRRERNRLLPPAGSLRQLLHHKRRRQHIIPVRKADPRDTLLTSGTTPARDTNRMTETAARPTTHPGATSWATTGDPCQTKTGSGSTSEMDTEYEVLSGGRP